METVKQFSRRAFVIVMGFTLVLFALTAALLYIGAGGTIDYNQQLSALGFLLAYGLLMWVVLRIGIKGIFFRADAPRSTETKTMASAVSPEDKKTTENRNRRVYLHLLSVLQREGRLLDFLAEDLEQYNDAQIGAAVRGIHASCKKSILKTIGPKAVMAADEGSEVEVPEDFDPVAIKLIGNVAGDPPFRGILRHKGWQAKTFELPDLAADQAPVLIAPAEVEVQ